MPKKDTASVVAGMLSTVGAQTRPSSVPTATPAAVAPSALQTAPAAVDPPTLQAAPQPEHVPASISALPTPPPSTTTAANDAPRTLRLRPETAQKLRAAWLEAKRDDVLLTAQDFASNLVEDALRRRRRTANSS